MRILKSTKEKEKERFFKMRDYSRLSEITVKNQTELDEIPLNFKGRIYIDCGPNDWIKVRHSYYYPVVIKGNSSVVVCVFPPVVSVFSDFPTVEAYDKSTIVLNGYSFVKAYGQSSVEAYDLSAVVAFDFSSVKAFDMSRVKTYDESSAVLYDDSSAKAFDKSKVKAFQTSSVRAFDESSVEAFDFSSVGAFDKSSVEAWEFAAIRAYADSSIKAYGNSQVVDFVQGAKIEVFDNARKVYGI
jgi:hypothetical protein